MLFISLFQLLLIFMNIIAVTACISGVAHTYMAAEQLEKLCNKKGFHIKVETQGALGIEHALSEEDITAAQVVIIAADINIDGIDRFQHSRVIRVSLKSLLRNPDIILPAIQKVRNAPPSTVIEVS